MTLGEYLLVWRQAVRDSDLDRTAKLVAYTVETYVNTDGEAFPSKATIAAGAGLGAGRRAVDTAVERIQEAELFHVVRSLGRVPFRYRPTLPTSHPLATFASSTTSHGDATFLTFADFSNVARSVLQRRTKRAPTSHPGATEALKASKQRGASLESSAAACICDHDVAVHGHVVDCPEAVAA